MISRRKWLLPLFLLLYTAAVAGCAFAVGRWSVKPSNVLVCLSSRKVVVVRVDGRRILVNEPDTEVTPFSTAIPDYSFSVEDYTRLVRSEGGKLALEDLKPGDLILIAYTGDRMASAPSHLGPVGMVCLIEDGHSNSP